MDEQNAISAIGAAVDEVRALGVKYEALSARMDSLNLAAGWVPTNPGEAFLLQRDGADRPFVYQPPSPNWAGCSTGLAGAFKARVRAGQVTMNSDEARAALASATAETELRIQRGEDPELHAKMRDARAFIQFIADRDVFSRQLPDLIEVIWLVAAAGWPAWNQNAMTVGWATPHNGAGARIVIAVRRGRNGSADTYSWVALDGAPFAGSPKMKWWPSEDQQLLVNLDAGQAQVP